MLGAQRLRVLVENYDPGDVIFLLGFSRGAFTARNTAGFIRNAEILRGEPRARVDHIRRPGSKDPDHESVADTAVDRHHRDRRYAATGLIEYLDAGGPVIPVAPARRRARPAPPRRERDRVNKPALVQSETTVGRMR